MFSNVTVIDVRDLLQDLQPHASELIRERPTIAREIHRRWSRSEPRSSLEDLIVRMWFMRNIEEYLIIDLEPSYLRRMIDNHILPQEFYENTGLLKPLLNRLWEPLHPTYNQGFHDRCAIDVEAGCLWLKFKKRY